jgi:PD-(D/E)XK endonuclease
MDSRTRLGSLAEAKVIAKLVENKFDVFIQFSGKASFDLVAYRDGQLYKIQVKGTSSKTRYGVYQVQLKAVRANRTGNTIHYFDTSQCDVLAIYVEPLDKVCFLRTEEIRARGQLNLREQPRLQERAAWVIAELEDVSRILRGHTRGA